MWYGERVILWGGCAMGFADKFVWSLNSHDLRDDELHHDLDPIAAAAIADCGVETFGALLCRVKYADGAIHKEFEGNPGNLAQLLRLWNAEVTKRGKARQWVRISTARDVETEHILYKRVAEASLAHWLDGKCVECRGSGVTNDRAICKPCKGAGEAEVVCSGAYERERIKDMISELHGIATGHALIASRLLRKEDL